MDAKELNALVHDREAAFYDDRFLIDYSPAIGKEVRRELARVLGAVPEAKRALDVACGTGYLAAGLAAAGIAEQTHSTDLSAEMAVRARDNVARAGATTHVTVADGERLPYGNGTFDLVVARGALHHLPDPLEALKEIRRVLEPGGTAVVLAEPTPNGERQVAAVVGIAVKAVEAIRRARKQPADEEKHMWEMASIAANLHTFEPADIETLAEKAGFEEITTSTASWAWILTLGLNYYLMGEFATPRALRNAAATVARAAAAFDRAVSDRLIPPAWRHTVQAVMR